jgi:hypothetical protein
MQCRQRGPWIVRGMPPHALELDRFKQEARAVPLPAAAL